MSYKPRRKVSVGLFPGSKKIRRLFFLPLNFQHLVSETSLDTSTAWINSGNLISPVVPWPDTINNPMTLNSSRNPLPAPSLQAPEWHLLSPFLGSPLEPRAPGSHKIAPYFPAPGHSRRRKSTLLFRSNLRIFEIGRGRFI